MANHPDNINKNPWNDQDPVVMKSLRANIFALVEEEKLPELKAFFRKNPQLVLVENNFRLTPLMYAILKGKKAIVDWLIKETIIRFKDTVLIAIVINDMPLVLKLLKIKKFSDSPETPLFFPPYMTPLMLASLCNNYTMVTLFMSYGERLNIPHRPDCACEECERDTAGNNWVNMNFRRIHEYRALCSHCYLLQDDIEDPILEAFMITRDLEKCEQLDSTCADIFVDIAEHVRKLPLALLNCCLNDEEVLSLLKQPEGAPKGTLTQFPRVRLAIDTKQKEFISDPRCLKMLKQYWLGEWNDWEAAPPLRRMWRLLIHTVFYPISSLLYIASNGRMPQSYEYPLPRFISFTTSYIVFLMSLVMFTQYHESRILRGAPDNKLKMAIIFYIWSYMLGMFVVSWADLIRLGFRRFLYAWWRWYDFIQLITYFLAFNAYLVSWVLVSIHGEPYAHRSHWDPLHPTLVFEVLFTIAAVLSSWRLFYFLQIMRSFGPLVISIGRCVKDIILFLLVFLVVVGSFALGLNFLLEHYKYNVAIRDGKLVEQPFFMTSIQSAVRYLYWAWYGYLDPERLEVIVGNYGPDGTEVKHAVVQYAAEFLSALYYVILVISLLNLMISIMATTAGSILEHKDREWKFVCCQMWCEFFHESRTLPPPICLLQLAIYGSIWVIKKLTGSKANINIWNSFTLDEANQEKRRHKYQALVKVLKQRLLCRRYVEEMMGTEFVKVYGLGSGSVILRNPNVF